MIRRWIAVALALALSISLVPPPTAASGSWLDGPLAPWNGPGMTVPNAPTLDEPIDAGSATQARAPETTEDEALVAAGWQLYAPLQVGWGVKVIEAAAGYDSTGRPIQYQAFIFVDGALAGTLSPELMSSGADGALERVILAGGHTVLAEFRRHAENRPSGVTTVDYEIDRSGPDPILVPLSAETVAAPPAPVAETFVPGPTIMMDVSEERVNVGQQFTVQLEATGAGGIDKLIWRGTGTDDIELQQPREYDCGGASSCRSSWPVTTTDTTGRVTIVAIARDVHGRHTEEIVQELTVDKATSKPTVELKISRSTVSAGERFKIEVHARSGQAIDKIWWYATDTSDSELKRNHESKCDGSEACRATWDVETTDSSGTITIVAKARDKSGRESDRVTQKLRIVR